MRRNLQIAISKHLSILSKIAAGIIICLLVSVQSGYGQDVDNSRSNKRKLRETKLKTRNKQGEKNYKGDITGRKKKTKKTKSRDKINSPSSTPYSNAFYQGKNRKKEGKQVQKSDGYFNTPSRPAENHRKGDISGRKPRRSVTRSGESKSVKAPSNPYAGRKNRTEGQKAKSSRAQGGGFQSASSTRETNPKKRKRIQPRTASRAFIARGKVNAYAGRARRGERAKTKDIAGRKIRSKNFRSRSQPIIKPSFNPYYAKKRKGDQARTAIKGSGYASASKKGERKYKGQAAGGYSTASKKGENAWRKDITGRKFKRPSDPGVSTGKKGLPYTGTQNRTLSISGALKNNNRRALSTKGAGGSISSNIRKGKGQALPKKALGNPRVGGFAGKVKGSKGPLKGGGGSISSNIWKGKGQAMPRKDLGSPRVSGFSGNVKGSRKPLKGGGSITNNIWQGKGRAMPRKDLGSPRVSGFAGNVKGSRKPLKGGGSITNSIWQGKGQAMPRKDLGSPRVSGFAGNVKGSRKPLKGGGSISNNIWQGKGQAIPRKDLGNPRVSGFAGNVKGSRKPLKGGGSITKSGWNNNRTPLIHKFSQNKSIANFKGRFNRFSISPGYTTTDIGKYQGTIKGYKSKTIGQPEGTEFKGRFKRFEISPGYTTTNIGKYRGKMKMKSKYKDKPNAVDQALKAKEPHKNMFQMSGYKGTMKDRRKHSKKPNAHEDALKGIAPRKAVAKLDSYVPKYVKVKYSKKPNAHKDALMGKVPNKAVAKLDSYVPKYAKIRYSKKPNAHKDALKGRAPKNSASKAIAFQGNFKVKKNYDKNMHPSSKYTTSLHPRNSLEEKNKTFKFNIWWAKLFKKNENQPTAVKEKTRNPRYDKREKDLWYD